MTDREQEVRAEALDDILEAYSETGLFRDWNIPKVNALVRTFQAELMAWADAHRPTEPDADLLDVVEDVFISHEGSPDADRVIRCACAEGSAGTSFAEHFCKAMADAIRARFHVTPHGAEPDEDNWEYGCANFGDLDDLMTVPGPLALQGKTEREWAEGVLQPEYGDILVRRRKASAWEPVTPRGEQP